MPEMVYTLTVSGNDDYDFVLVLKEILRKCEDGRSLLPGLVKIEQEEGLVVGSLHLFTTIEDRV